MYTPISCVLTGRQQGEERFPDPSDEPPLKSWRCNLTAFSQSYNLYFVACNTSIHIYEPEFPAQSLDEPARVLEVPRSPKPQGVPYGIDYQDPHSVTRVLVDWFGDEEVLVCACDDGDVVAWWVGEIHRAIVARRNVPGAEDDDELCAIRPFEVHNVHASAWGLAVHRNARLLAASANTHEVRVLVYALSEKAEGDPYERARNGFIRLQAKSNIPSVSFDNTGADPNGRWLASSSIDGLTHLWDLTTPKAPPRVIALKDCVDSMSSISAMSIACRCPDRHLVPHAAWGAMFLDPRSFHHVDSLADACGPGITPNNEVTTCAPCFWDITDRRKPRYGRYLPSPDATVEIDAAPEASSSDEEVDADDDSLFVHLGDPPTYAGAGISTPPLSTSTTPSLPPQPLHPTSPLPNEPDTSSDEEEVLGFDPFQHPFSPATLSSRPLTPRTKSLSCAFQTDSTLRDHIAASTHIPSPLLIITHSEIYLLPSPLSPTPTAHPILAMRNPLHTSSSTNTLSAASHRHSFSAQIPPLGIVIVATPSGRAGIFRLTQTRHNAAGVVYAFRLEWMLVGGGVWAPGEAGLAEGEESGRVLVGLGVAPVQGMEGGKEAGRWRVVLHFKDQGVVAYEVGKFGAGGVEEVVV